MVNFNKKITLGLLIIFLLFSSNLLYFKYNIGFSEINNLVMGPFINYGVNFSQYLYNYKLIILFSIVLILIITYRNSIETNIIFDNNTLLNKFLLLFLILYSLKTNSIIYILLYVTIFYIKNISKILLFFIVNFIYLYLNDYHSIKLHDYFHLGEAVLNVSRIIDYRQIPYFDYIPVHGVSNLIPFSLSFLIFNNYLYANEIIFIINFSSLILFFVLLRDQKFKIYLLSLIYTTPFYYSLLPIIYIVLINSKLRISPLIIISLLWRPTFTFIPCIIFYIQSISINLSTARFSYKLFKLFEAIIIIYVALVLIDINFQIGFVSIFSGSYLLQSKDFLYPFNNQLLFPHQLFLRISAILLALYLAYLFSKISIVNFNFEKFIKNLYLLIPFLMLISGITYFLGRYDNGYRLGFFAIVAGLIYFKYLFVNKSINKSNLLLIFFIIMFTFQTNTHSAKILISNYNNVFKRNYIDIDSTIKDKLSLIDFYTNNNDRIYDLTNNDILYYLRNKLPYGRFSSNYNNLSKTDTDIIINEFISNSPALVFLNNSNQFHDAIDGIQRNLLITDFFLKNNYHVCNYNKEIFFVKECFHHPSEIIRFNINLANYPYNNIIHNLKVNTNFVRGLNFLNVEISCPKQKHVNEDFNYLNIIKEFNISPLAMNRSDVSLQIPIFINDVDYKLIKFYESSCKLNYNIYN